MNHQRIGYATEKMFPAIRNMWHICFGDDMEYISFYLTHRFTPDNMMVYCVNDTPVSMISLLPATLFAEGKQYPVRYVYAVATLPDYRKNGYARALIQTAHKHLDEPLILEPASRELQGYYEKMGFKSAFTRKTQTYSTEQIVEAQGEENGQCYWLLTITPSEYRARRDLWLGTTGSAYVTWDDTAIAYALLENDYCDGYAYKISHHGEEDILLFREEKDMITVLETSLSEADLLAVMKKLRINRPVVVRRPAQAHRIGTEKVSAAGMLLGDIQISNGYLGLTLE